MNSVNLIGRIANEINYSRTENESCRTIFSLALDRGKDKNGNDMGADFPGIICFGKLAEIVSKYCYKGMRIAVDGRITTSSYEKDGCRYYTTMVRAENIQFLDKKKE